MRLPGGLPASRAGIVQGDDEEEDDDKGVFVKEDHGNDHNVRMNLTSCFKDMFSPK